MKFFIFLIFMTSYVFAVEEGSEAPAPAESVDSSAPLVEALPSEEAVLEENSEVLEDSEFAVMEFLIQEVIPAFGGFQGIFFSKPSFKIHWTPEGIQIKHCSFTLQIEQLKAIEYNLADIQLYGFQSNAEIGGVQKLLFLEVLCGSAGPVEGLANFKIKLFVTDKKLNPSHYSFKIKTMGKEQFDLKLNSIEMDVNIEGVNDVLISDSDGYTKVLPQDSPFLKFFKEEKAYAETALESNEENTPIKNMYDIPLSVWDQIKTASFEDPAQNTAQGNESSEMISLKKLNIDWTIDLNGFAEILLPVYKKGVKEDALAVVPITGSVFSSIESGLIPMVDLSIK